MSDKKIERDGQSVFITGSDPVCDHCGKRIGKPGWIVPLPRRRAHCLACAGFGHLEFLPSGDLTLTRRATKASTLAIVVLQWKSQRKRYERQGVLVEPDALASAKTATLADAEVRNRRRQRAGVRRAELDVVYVAAFAARIRALYPGAPEGIETRIAEHACRKYSRRVGRSAAAKALDDEMIRLAVIASVRHEYTPYDELLGQGVERVAARKKVKRAIAAVLDGWTSGAGHSDPALRKTPR